MWIAVVPGGPCKLPSSSRRHPTFCRQTIDRSELAASCSIVLSVAISAVALPAHVVSDSKYALHALSLVSEWYENGTGPLRKMQNQDLLWILLRHWRPGFITWEKVKSHQHVNDAKCARDLWLIIGNAMAEGERGPHLEQLMSVSNLLKPFSTEPMIKPTLVHLLQGLPSFLFATGLLLIQYTLNFRHWPPPLPVLRQQARLQRTQCGFGCIGHQTWNHNRVTLCNFLVCTGTRLPVVFYRDPIKTLTSFREYDSTDAGMLPSSARGVGYQAETLLTIMQQLVAMTRVCSLPCFQQRSLHASPFVALSHP